MLLNGKMKADYAGFLLAILLIGCTGTYYVEPEGIEPETLFRSGHVFDYPADPIEVVLRSPESWESFLSSYPTKNMKFARDRFWHVDYNRHMVVGVALGGRGSGSISVTIDSLRVVNDRVVVYATEFRPLIGTRDFVNPAHFIVVQRSSLPVKFEEIYVKEQKAR